MKWERQKIQMRQKSPLILNNLVMKSERKSILKGVVISGMIAGTVPAMAANTNDLLNFDVIGSGAELRTQLLEQYGSPIDAVNQNSENYFVGEAKCGENKCGEGKCGKEGKKEGKKEAKKAGKSEKTGEAKCGENTCGEKSKKEAKKEGKEKTGEAKCGENTCGGVE